MSEIFLQIIIGLYLVINSFLAGVYYEEEKHFTKKSGKEFWSLIFVLVLIVLFAIPTIIIASIWGWIIRPIMNYLHIRHLWYLWFTKKFHKIDPEKLNYINTRPVPKTCRPIYRYILNSINNRNNYTPKSEQKNDEHPAD